MKFFHSWRSYARVLGTSISTLKRIVESDPDAATKVEISPGRVGFPDDEVERHCEVLRERQKQRDALRALCLCFAVVFVGLL